MSDLPFFQFTTQEDWYWEIPFANADAGGEPLPLQNADGTPRQFVVPITPAKSGGRPADVVCELSMNDWGNGISFKEGDRSTLIFRLDREATDSFPRGEFTADILEIVGGRRHMFLPVRINWQEPGAVRSFLRRMLGVSWSASRQPIVTPVAIAGREGRPGATIITGTVPPVPADGKDGDFFIEDRGAGRGRRMYGPKAAGAWPGTPWNIQVAAISDVPGLPDAIAATAQRAANLADLADKDAARGNLGLGNVDNTADAAKPVSVAQGMAIAGRLAAASNLSDLADKTAARGNLGLGSAATETADSFRNVKTLGAGSVDRPVYAAVRERGVPVTAFGVTDGNITNALPKAWAARAEHDANDPWRKSSPLLLPPGLFYLDAPFAVEMTGITGRVPDHYAFEGAGCGQTVVEYRGPTGAMISYKGSNDGQGSHSLLSLKNMLLVNNGQGIISGVKMESAAYFGIENVHTLGFDVHWDLIDCLSGTFKGLRYVGGRRGIHGRRGAGSNSSCPNAITNIGSIGSGAREWAEYWDTPGTYTRIGGTIEGNGTDTSFAERGGICLKTPGLESNQGATILGAYFEYNAGTADILLDGISRGPGVVNVSSSFNLVDPARAPTNCIFARNGTTDPLLTVNVAGSGFGHFGAYTPSAANPYLRKSGQVLFAGTQQCSFGSTVQRPAGFLGAFASCQFNGTLASPTNQLGATAITNVDSIVKNAAGDFTINFGCRRTGGQYFVTAFYIGAGITQMQIAEAADQSVRLLFYNASGQLTDPNCRLRIDC